MARKYGFMFEFCHENIKSIFPRHREMFCLLYGLTLYSDPIIHNDDENWRFNSEKQFSDQNG